MEGRGVVPAPGTIQSRTTCSLNLSGYLVIVMNSPLTCRGNKIFPSSKDSAHFALGLGNPVSVDSGGDFEVCGDGEDGAVDDGFLANVLDGGGMGDVEAGAAGGVVEIGPDNFLVIVGQ